MKSIFPEPLPEDFCASEYKRCNPECSKLTSLECELHYIREGRKNGLDYKTETTKAKKLQTLAMRVNALPRGFNVECYRKYNSDISDYSDAWLINHFIKYGKYENRLYKEIDLTLLPEDFDPNKYKQMNEDLSSLDTLELQIHYIRFGKQEGRLYNNKMPKDYNRQMYVYYNPDLKNLTDKEIDKHFILFSQKENRKWKDPLFDLKFFRNEIDNKFATYETYLSDIRTIKSKQVQEIVKQPIPEASLILLNHESSLQGATHYLYSLKQVLSETNPKLKTITLEPHYNSLIEQKYNVTKNQDFFVYEEDATVLYHLIKKSKATTILVNCINFVFETIRSYIEGAGIRIIDHSHEIKKHYFRLNQRTAPSYVVSAQISKQWKNVPRVQPPFLSKEVLQQIDESKKVNTITNLYGKINFNRITIGMCGALSERKNYKLFIKLSKLYPDYNFIWIGGEANKCFLGIKNLYHIENTPNPFGIYKQLDYFLLTAKEDPCPYVVLENLYLNNKVIVFKKNIYTTHNQNVLKDLYFEYPKNITINNAKDAINKFVKSKKTKQTNAGKDYIIKNYTKLNKDYMEDITKIKQISLKPDKEYSPKEPLVYLHLYKTAGTSVNQIFQRWFPSQYIKHKDGANQDKRLITCTSENINKNKHRAPVYFGHFNYDGKFKWPEECKQFVTMLRDPFELQVSAFYYAKKMGFHLHTDNVEEYILTSNFHYGFTKIFTKERLTFENYKEVLSKYFIVIGSLKNYEKSLKTMAKKLNKNFEEAFLLIKKNVSSNSDSYYVPEHLREFHKEIFPLEYQIYDYVNELYGY